MTRLERWMRSGDALVRPGRTSRPVGGSGGSLTPQSVWSRGSLPPGQKVYPVPTSGTVYWVDPVNGSDSNAGTSSGSPWKTIGKAAAAMASNSTLIMRGGVYGPGVGPGAVWTAMTDNATKGYTATVFSQSNITVQAAPGETVWWDGSELVDPATFSADGGWWSKAYTPFRRDPQIATWYGGTYPPAANNWAALDDPTPDWQFYDYGATYPGLWPEISWIDGIRCQQVWQLSDMVAGMAGAVDVWGNPCPTVFFDAYANQWYLPINPTGHTIRITTRQTIFNALGAGQTYRGFGIRRYATLQPQGAAIKLHRNDATLEHLWLEDIQGTAVTAIGASNSLTTAGLRPTYRNLTVVRPGACGLSAHMVNDLVIDSCKVVNANIQDFNFAPSAGSVKIDETYGATITNSEFKNANGKHFWTDVDVQNVLVSNCDFDGSEDSAIVLELSRGLTVANNRIINCRVDDPIRLMDSEDFVEYNNAYDSNGSGNAAGAAWNVNRMTDNRTPREGNYISYHDDRITNGLLTWPTNPGGYLPNKTKSRNNVHGAGGNGYYGDRNIGTVNAGSHRDGLSAAAGLDVDHNWYNGSNGTLGGSRPYPWAVRDGSGTNRIRTTIATWRTLTAANACGQQDTNSAETLGVATTDGAGNLLSGYAAAATAVAEAIPSDIAGVIGVPAGTQMMGIRARRSAITQIQGLIEDATTAAPLDILCPGSSSFYGGGSGIADPRYSNSMLGKMRAALEADYGSAGTGYVAATAYVRANPSNDPRWGFGGTVTDQPYGWFTSSCYQVGSGSPNYVTFTATCTSFVLHRIGTSSGTCQVSVDGGSTQTLSNTPNSGTGAAKLLTDTVSAGALGSHTIKIWSDSGTVQLLGVEGRTGTGRIMVSSAAYPGKNFGQAFATNDETNGRWGQPLLDDRKAGIVLIGLGGNDWQAGQDMTQHKARLATVFARIRQQGGVPVLWIQPVPSSTLQASGGPTWEQWRAAQVAQCADSAVQCIDHSYLFGATYEAGYAAGAYADTIHPSNSGAATLATAIRTALGI